MLQQCYIENGRHGHRAWENLARPVFRHLEKRIDRGCTRRDNCLRRVDRASACGDKTLAPEERKQPCDVSSLDAIRRVRLARSQLSDIFSRPAFSRNLIARTTSRNRDGSLQPALLRDLHGLRRVPSIANETQIQHLLQRKNL